jgi:hypothetical protein
LHFFKYTSIKKGKKKVKFELNPIEGALPRVQVFKKSLTLLELKQEIVNRFECAFNNLKDSDDFVNMNIELRMFDNIPME